MLEQVSAVLIVKNAAADLARCLDSLRWVNEIVVVDALSSDNTVEIARRYTDKVIQRPWPGFAEQKNFAISQAAHSWVLSIDADEVLPPETIAEIQSVLASPQALGYRFPRRNIFLGHWVKGCGWYPDWQLRLFRKDAGAFQAFHVHESVAVNGPVVNLTNPILHYSYTSISHYFGKSNHYTNLEVDDHLKNSTRISDLSPFRGFCDRFILAYKQQEGWRDQLVGLFVSTGQALYEYYRYLKTLNYYEATGRGHLISREGRNLTALAQFREALTQLGGANGSLAHRVPPQVYSGLPESLTWIARRDLNSFLGEANRLSDRDADRIVSSLIQFSDLDILAKPVEVLRLYPESTWNAAIQAMGAFTYAFMVWSKVWERLVWHNKAGLIRQTLVQESTANELIRKIQWAARYVWFAQRG